MKLKLRKTHAKRSLLQIKPTWMKHVRRKMALLGFSFPGFFLAWALLFRSDTHAILIVMSESCPICPWSFLDVSETVPPKSYAAATTTSIIPIASLPLLVIRDGRTIVTISEEGYQSGLENCKHMLLGHLHLSAKDKPYSSFELRKKLGLIWGEIGHWRVIPMG